MRLSVLQLTADLHKQYRAVLLGYGILAFLGSHVGIHFFKLACGDGVHLAIQIYIKLGKIHL